LEINLYKKHSGLEKLLFRSTRLLDVQKECICCPSLESECIALVEEGLLQEPPTISDLLIGFCDRRNQLSSAR
jgi:hypothetical protein